MKHLLEAGFEASGMTFVKKMCACDMPFVREHMLKQLKLSDFSEVEIEVSANGSVRIIIDEVNYVEEENNVYSEDGQMLLYDAGMLIKDEDMITYH